MVYVGKMVSLIPEDNDFLVKEGLSASKVLRSAIEICRAQNVRDPSEPITKLQRVTAKLYELIAAYELDAKTIKQDVR